MTITPEIIAEMQVLRLFDATDAQKGIKVHSDANATLKAAAERLFNKQLVSQVDGGYLTPLGYETAVHLQQLLQILNSKTE